MDLWVNKYAPKKSSDILGNNSTIKKIKEWLQTFSKKSKYKIILLIGPPGIGKTTAANILSEECNYKVIEYNASDSRTEKALRENLSDVTNNTTLDDFFKPASAVNKIEPPSKKRKTTPQLNKKTVILMDEADGMTDGGISELIRMSKNSSSPIICICNFENKSIGKLSNIALKLRFYPIPIDMIEKRVKSIMKKEGFKKIDDGTLYEIIINCDHDMRQILTYLQNKRIVTDKLDDIDLEINKDVSTDMIFNMVKDMFSKRERLDRKLELYFQDSFFFPLFIQENYVKLAPNLEILASASDYISLGDMVNNEIYTQQNFGLMELAGLYSTVIPSKLVKYQNCRIDFPKSLGLYKKVEKGNRITRELTMKMAVQGLGGSTQTGNLLDFFPNFIAMNLKQLKKDGKDAVPKILDYMKLYNINKDDLDEMIQLVGKEEEFKSVDTKVRSYLTREYNKMINPSKKKTKKTKTKTKK